MQGALLSLRIPEEWMWMLLCLPLIIILSSPTWVMTILQDLTGPYILLEQILLLTMFIRARWLIGGEKLPIDNQLEIWSLFHSTRLIVKSVSGLSQMSVHVMHAMKIGDICICLRNLHQGCI
jgi:hypothetical protein